MYISPSLVKPILELIQLRSKKLRICSCLPNNYSEAYLNTLASKPLMPYDFALAKEDTELIVGQLSLEVIKSGEVRSLTLVSAAYELLLVHPLYHSTTLFVLAGNTLNLQPWTIRLGETLPALPAHTEITKSAKKSIEASFSDLINGSWDFQSQASYFKQTKPEPPRPNTTEEKQEPEIYIREVTY